MRVYPSLGTDLDYTHLQNHDNEPNITHLEEIQREQSIAPLSYTRVAPPGIGGEGGPGTYWVPVAFTLSLLAIIKFNKTGFISTDLRTYRWCVIITTMSFPA